MDTHVDGGVDSQITQPWNKGRLTGAKPPLSPKHVWAVRTRLQLLKRLRDLALFNLQAGCYRGGHRPLDCHRQTILEHVLWPSAMRPKARASSSDSASELRRR
jgi:hypothetical protein